MSPQTTAHLLKYDTVMGTLQADVVVSDESLTIDGKEIKLLNKHKYKLNLKQMHKLLNKPH